MHSFPTMASTERPQASSADSGLFNGAIAPEPGMRRNLEVGDTVEVAVEGLGSMEQEVIDMPAWPY